MRSADRSEISATPERADKLANREGLPAGEGALKVAAAELIKESSRKSKYQQIVRAGVLVENRSRAPVLY